MAQPQSSTVFIVDDNPGDRTLIRMMIEQFAPGRFQIEEAWNMADALKRLQAGGISVLILDLNLPDSRGVASLTKVQTAKPGLPVVVVTGVEDRQAIARVLESSGQEYFVKGQFSFEMLGNTLNRCLSSASERLPDSGQQ